MTFKEMDRRPTPIPYKRESGHPDGLTHHWIISSQLGILPTLEASSLPGAKLERRFFGRAYSDSSDGCQGSHGPERAPLSRCCIFEFVCTYMIHDRCMKQ